MADVTASLVEDLNLKISGSVAPGLAGSASSSLGVLSLSSTGLWTYTPKPAAQTLRLGESQVDTLVVGGRSFAITLHGVNDFALFGGATKGSVAEDKPLAVSGTLSVTDADAGESSLSVDSFAYFGNFSFNLGSKLWIYTPNAERLQSLRPGQKVVESLTVFSSDGSSSVVAVTLSGANDAAVFSGTSLAVDLKTNVLTRLAEADSALLSASGRLAVTDPDADSSSFQKLEKAGKLGWLSLAADGEWTYRADGLNPLVQKLASGQSLADSFVIKSADGLSSQAVTVLIDGTSDNSTLGGRAAMTTKAATATLFSGSVTASIFNLDTGAALSAEEKASLVLGSHAGSYGGFSLAADGKWTYTLDYNNAAVIALPAGATLTDSVLVGGARLKVAITGINEAPISINSPVNFNLVEDAGLVDGWLIASGSLSINDPDAGQSGFVKQTISSSTSLYSLAEDGSWSYRIRNTDASLQKLVSGQSLVKKFTAKSLDGKASTSVSITLQGSNALTLSGDSGQTFEDQTSRAQGKLFSLDAGKALTASPALIQGSYGLFSIAKDGRWSYLQQQDLGEGTFADSVAVTSSAGIVSLNVKVSGSNDAAQWSGDFFSVVNEDSGSGGGSLAISDPDLDQSRFIASSVTGLYGSFVVDAAGAWSYTLDSRAQALGSEASSDSFLVYSAEGGSNAVTIQVNGSNDAPAITSLNSFSGDEDASISASVAVSDVDNSSFSYSVGTASKGSVSINAAGLWTYAPNANANGSDSFTLTVFDGSGGSAAQTVNLTVNPVNDAPAISSASSFNGSEDVTLSSSVTASDVEGSSLSYGVSGNARASIIGSTWTYAPAANFYGSDSFTLTVSDGVASATQIITVHLAAVNDAPAISSSNSFSGDEDVSISSNVTVGDVDNSSFSYSVGTASKGSVSINAAGLWTYAPDANSNGSDSFTLTVFDGSGGSAAQTLNLTVNPVNDAPAITSSNSFSGDEDASISASVAVGDVDNTSFSYSVGTASKGNVSINAAGLWTYAPNANANGSDSFTLTVFDGSGGSAAQTLNLTVNPVNDAPAITSSNSFSGDEDASISASVAVSDVDNTSFSYSVGTASKGSVSINAAGLWTYAPNANANGSDSFTLTVFDGSGGSAAQTINLTVNAVNDTPAISSASSFNGSEDVALSSSVTASDVEGSSLSYGVSGNARASISGSTWTYAPAANFYGSDSFTLTVSDGAASVTQTITVHLAAVNDAPVVSGGSSGSGDEDSSLTGTLVVSDVDGMADGSYFTLATQAVSGIASIDPVNGAWTYAAAANFNGSDSFVVLITDDLGSTSTQTISLNLAAVNDLPVFGSGISGSATEDQILPVSGSLGISDVDAGESFLVARTGVAGSYGSFSIDSAGAWSYTLDNGKAAVQGLGAGQSTAESFLVSSFDGSASQAVTISIQGRNDLALISGTASASIQEEQASVSASLSISDPDSGESAFVPRSAVAGSYGSFSINAAGAWNFVLDNSKTAVQALASGSSVSESFLVSSLDGGSSQNVTVILQGVNDIPVISGTSSVEISEDDSSASGSLGIVDADSSESSFIAATASSSYGVLDFATDGSWSFTTAKAAQALNTGVSVSLSLTAISKDGSASSVLSVVLQGQSEPLAWLDLKEDLDLNLVPDLIDSGAVRRYSGPADSIAGESLASGDFNGDGVQDFLFGAYGVAPAGAAYLLDGQSAAGGSLSPGSLLISGDDAGDIAGATVRACGDFDGDGFGDFLVAAPAAAELYLIYGSASLSAVNLSVDGDADGLPDVLEAGAGLRIRGPASEGFGDALAAADLNGDGYSDLAIGVRLADSSTQVDCGKVVIVFGGATRPGAAIDLSVDLNADQIPDYLAAGGGLQIFGQGAYDDFGASLDGGGDVNGDGIEDLLVGAKGADRSGSNAGSAYLLYGRTGLWSSSLDLHADTNANSLPDAFDAGQGLRLDGASGQGLGSSVALLGDVNGDGYGDFALGAEAAGSGRAWVLHGGAALPVQIDLATDAGGNGLADWIELHGGAQIHGFAAGDYFGHALAAAGDVNGDGYADVLVAASGMDFSGRSDAGGVVLLFGGLTLDGRIELALDDGSLPSSNSADGRPDFLENGGGVLIAGAAAQDALEGLMLAAAGDIDGDGFDDFLAAFGNAGGGQGYSFLIRGQDFLNGLGGLLSGTSRSGSAAADIFVGSAVAETFSSIGSGDSVRCGAGDDILSLSASGFLHLDGGLGDDRLILNLASLDLSGISAGRLRSWEIFDLSYEGPQSVSLDVDALRHLEVDGGALRILRDVDDSVTLTGFTLGSSRNIDGQDYAIWTAAAAPSLEIQVLELI